MAASSATIITDPGSIAAFNRGPLTSVFTPPASCLSTLTFVSDMYFGHQSTYYFDPACFPPSITSTQTTGSTSDSWALYYYSPGQCPSGWSHATTMSYYFSGFYGSSQILSLGVDTTAVLCCPSGFIYPSDGVDHQCQSIIASAGTLTYFEPTAFQNSFVQGTAGTFTVGTYNVYGDGIPVWWQSSDLAAFSAASLTTTSSSSLSTTSTATSSSPKFSTPTPTATGTGTGTGTGIPSPLTSSPVQSGLSTRGKAAIGVCVPIVSIAIFVAVFYYFRYRKLKEQQHQVQMSEEHFYNIGMTGNPKVQGLSGNAYELSNERPAAEVDSNIHNNQLGTAQQLPYTVEG